VVVAEAPGDVRTFLVPKERKKEFVRVLEALEGQATMDNAQALTT
jgi:hypothetical protein